jgi:predicted DCC family thiol-disulfide oxidoreductase YuxK
MHAPAPPQRLILFDGVCAVCNEGMRWIMEHDPAGRFHYAPLQGDTAAEVRARHPELPADLDSLVFVDRTSGGEVVLWHSAALLGIARHLGAPWSLARALWLVPAPLRDLGYRLFAAARYRVFGKVDACRLPSESEAARMLP